jgi:hypothetical protein
MDNCCGIETNAMRYIEAHIQMVLNGLTVSQKANGQLNGHAAGSA